MSIRISTVNHLVVRTNAAGNTRKPIGNLGTATEDPWSGISTTTSKPADNDSSVLVAGTKLTNILDLKNPRTTLVFETSEALTVAYVQFDLTILTAGENFNVSEIALINHNISSSDEIYAWGITTAKGAATNGFNTNLANENPHSVAPTAGANTHDIGIFGGGTGFVLNATNPTDATGTPQVGAAGTYTERNADSPLDFDGVNAGKMARAIAYLDTATAVRYVLIQVVRATSQPDLEIGGVWIGDYTASSPTGNRSAPSKDWQKLLDDKSEFVNNFNSSSGEARIGPMFNGYRLPFKGVGTTDRLKFDDVFSTALKTEPFLVAPLAEGSSDNIDKRDFVIGHIPRSMPQTFGVSNRADFTLEIEEFT